MTMEAKYIATDRVIRDIMDRRGLRQAWEVIEEGIRSAIREEWASLIDNAFGAPSADCDAKIWDMAFTATFGALMANAVVVSSACGNTDILINEKVSEEFADIAAQTAMNAVALAKKHRK